MKLAALGWFLLLLIGIVSTAIIWYHIFQEVHVDIPMFVHPTYTEQEKAWIKKRMRYHGTDHSWRDQRGYWFINKEGEKCRL